MILCMLVEVYIEHAVCVTSAGNSRCRESTADSKASVRPIRRTVSLLPLLPQITAPLSLCAPSSLSLLHPLPPLFIFLPFLLLFLPFLLSPERVTWQVSMSTWAAQRSSPSRVAWVQPSSHGQTESRKSANTPCQHMPLLPFSSQSLQFLPYLP